MPRNDAPTSPTLWPKAYLIRLLDLAIDEGWCKAQCNSVAQAQSLAASLNRIRRKADKLHAAFMRSEHDLVTLHADGNRVVLVYNLLPDDMAMPLVTSPGPRGEVRADVPGETINLPKPNVGEPLPTFTPSGDHKALTLEDFQREAMERLLDEPPAPAGDL